LIPTWIQSRGDLNVAEEDNIASGLAWAKRKRPKPLDIATAAFSCSLHKRMFGKVWRWACEYRQVELLGIGAAPWQIGSKSAQLFEQFRYWIEQGTFNADELAVRFHHRIVFVHAFTNGNGRHSRLMADLLVEKLDDQPFGWGGGNLQATGELRQRYIDALRRANNYDLKSLMLFARS
jgi:Fic-DOC domain mobile mystery protein B